MKYIYVVGCGGLAKEIFSYRNEFILNPDEKIIGFIDTNSKSNKNIINEDDFLKNYNKSDNFIVFGIGNPLILKKIKDKYSKFSSINLIHKSASINLNKIGVGNIIMPGCVISTKVKIGNYNIINNLSSIGHETQLGNFNIINPLVSISGNITIENYNLIGTSSTILQNLIIGSENIIGASTLILKNIKSHQTVFGVPGKTIKNA